MKKYKLKKDLPRANVGTTVLFKDNAGCLILNEDGTKFLASLDDENISEWLEEIPEKPKSVWNIKKQDEYYTIINGIIHQYDWSDSPNDKRILEDGNIFLTREEAEQELNKRQAIQRIKKYCWENNIELADESIMNDSKVKTYPIIYNPDSKIFWSDWSYQNFLSYFCFVGKYGAQKVIDNCKEDLRIIFNV